MCQNPATIPTANATMEILAEASSDMEP